MLPPSCISISTGGDCVFFVRKGCPINYAPLCRQTVTVYHKEGESYIRTVYDKAFLDHRKTETVDKTGSKEANSFLLVIPGSVQTVFVDDKIHEGVGPEIADSAAWREFVPAKVPGLVVAKYADCKHWAGQIVHTEAGG